MAALDALERARRDGLHIEPSDGMNEAWARCVKRDGSWYCVWASAGSLLESGWSAGLGYLVAFACQCPAGGALAAPRQHRRRDGTPPCKHTALLAHELHSAGVLTIDPEGLYRSPTMDYSIAGRRRPRVA